MIRAMSREHELVSPSITPREGVSWWRASREWSLTTRMLVAVGGYLVALLLVLLLTARQAEVQHRSVWLDQAGNSARAVAGTVAGFASDLDSTTRAMSLAIARTPGVIDQQNTGSYLRTIAEDYGVLRGLFVTDMRGRVIATQSGEGIGIDLSGRPYMQSLLTGADTIWSTGVAGIETGDVTVTFGRTVRDDRGAVRGYLVAAFYPPKLAERLAAWVPADADITLVDGNGLVLHSTKHPVIPFKQRTVQISGLAAAARESGRARLDGTPGVIDGLPTYGAAVPIPETGWTLIYARPVSAVDDAIQRQTLIQAAELTAAVAVVGVLLALSVTRITSPLRRLALAVQGVARGERPVIEVPEGQREVSMLAEAIQSMTVSIADREDSLRLEAQHRRVISDASGAFAEAGLNLGSALNTVAASVCDALHDACAVYLLNGDVLEPVAVRHVDPSMEERVRSVLANRLVRVGNGVAGRAAQLASTVVVADVLADTSGVAGPSQRQLYETMGVHSVAATPLQARGRTLGVISVWRDVTSDSYEAMDIVLLEDLADRAATSLDNARLYRESEENAAAIERAMHAHDEFMALASHDVKNPLAAIDATAQVLQRSISRGREIETDRLSEDMESIRNAVVKATSQIDASLDMARMHLGEPLSIDRKEMDLATLVRGLVDEYQRITERHAVGFECDPASVVGSWDGRRLERAFANLLANAVKYSPDGGRIDVEMQIDGGSVQIVVRDQGVGIPSDDLPRIFDRFFRASNVQSLPGSGLGLSGVRYIVEGHGGTVTVESEAGRGSTFTVRLPMGPVQPAPLPNLAANFQ